MNFGFLTGQAVSEKNMFESTGLIHVKYTVQYFYKHKSHVNLVICCKLFLLNGFVTIFSVQCKIDQIRHCFKICQGQPRVTILIHVRVEIESTMPHANFQDI